MSLPPVVMVVSINTMVLSTLATRVLILWLALKSEDMGNRTYWLKIKNIKMKVRFQYTIRSSIKDVMSSNFIYSWNITIKSESEAFIFGELDEDFQIDV